ncbi:hypothetical protein Tco_1292411 [Tanacetum coccineum]
MIMQASKIKKGMSMLVRKLQDHKKAKDSKMMKRDYLLGDQTVTFSARPVGIPIEVGSPSVNVAEPLLDKLGKRHTITSSLEESTPKWKNVTAGSSLKLEDKRRKQDVAPKRGNSKGSVPFPFPSTPFPKGVGKHPWIMACQFGIDEQDIDPLVPDFQEKTSYKHELEKLEDALSHARNNQDVEGSQAVKDLRRLKGCIPLLRRLSGFAKSVVASKKESDTFLSMEASLRNKFDALSSRLKVVDLEWVGLVKEFFPLFVKKLMASDHFNLAMADLSKKP